MKIDINYPPGEFAHINGTHVYGLTFAPEDQGAPYDDIWKFSASSDNYFEEVTVKAGKQRENALDMNNGSCRNSFFKIKLDAGAQPALYIKGGSCDNAFDNVLITRSGGHSDLYVGDYSNQSRAHTTGNKFNNIRRIDGQPIRVAWNMFRAEKPILTDSNVKYQYGWSLIRTIVVETKYLFT